MDKHEIPHFHIRIWSAKEEDPQLLMHFPPPMHANAGFCMQLDYASLFLHLH